MNGSAAITEAPSTEVSTIAQPTGLRAAAVCDRSPGELRRAVATAAGRKVIRLLDPLAMAPVLVASQLRDRVWPEVDAGRLGLLTISAAEPGATAGSDGALDDSAPRHATPARIDVPSAIEWLRALANNAHCQAAIAARLQGPSLHLIGRAAELEDGLALLPEWAAAQPIDGVVVVSFDWLDRRPVAVGLAMEGEPHALALLADHLPHHGPADLATQVLAAFVQQQPGERHPSPIRDEVRGASR